VPAAPAEDLVKQAEAKVERVSKKVSITSKVLIALGVIGVFCSLMHGNDARHMAQNIVSGKKPWGPPPTREEERAMGTQVVTRDELEIYDNLKSMSFLMFIMSILTIAIGKCGHRALWRKKS
jgi:cell division septation protein DedD